ncbi:MAG: Uma2 family endonuclease [Rhizobiaceae bacterium]|nr:Uma2 family endonuclease [Rhizobiaceae bacterium]
MNEWFPHDLPWPATTQAADGMPRRAWSVAEIEAMVEAGIIDEHERFELIGGEVVPMSPKGARHEMVKAELNEHFQRLHVDDYRIVPETTLRLDEKAFLEPDFCVFPRAISPGDMRGYDVRLAVEIADTSLRYDLGRKPGVYGAYGIPEVWVIDARTLVTHVHRRLGAEGYREKIEVPPEGEVVSAQVEAIRFSFATLGLRPL